MNAFLFLVLLAIAVLYFWYASLVWFGNQVFQALSGGDFQRKARSADPQYLGDRQEIHVS